MKNPIFRFLPAIIFAGVALFAIFQNQDYVEAIIWGFFALAVILPAFPEYGISRRTLQIASVVLLVAGIILLILRLLNVLPVPVRPLP